jgi:cobaltochelatase CobS
MTVATPVEHETRIECRLCGAKVHSIELHLRKDPAHQEKPVTLAEYQSQFPDAPIISAIAQQKVAEQKALRQKAAAAASEPTVSADLSTVGFASTVDHLHELFSLGRVKAALNSRGEPIGITKYAPPEQFRDMVPDVDPNYVFNLDVLKTMIQGLEMRIPTYLWGHSGTGKTTIFEQIAARTGRPMFRVQHTANMEEEHVIGGWRLRGGETIFDLGPLPMAMKHGWLYMADEYDFARPEVTSLYQAVLEGKPLIIKEADEANRVIRPHPAFRIVATGNTNGQGDETGLYNGTTMQNAANYERFGIVEKMPYMEAAIEARLVSQQADIPLDDAKRLVDFAGRVRAEFDSSKLSNPISPRSLIYAGRIGLVRGSYLIGLEKAYINRLGTVDREAASQLAARVFPK